MITRRPQYNFVNGDIDNVIINGGIMPRRSLDQKRILRGEDPCFLLEGTHERMSWWEKTFTGYHREYISNQSFISSAVPFSSAVSLNAGAYGIRDVAIRMSTLYGGSGWLKTIPDSGYWGLDSSVRFETYFANDICKAEDMSFTGFDTNKAILMQPVQNLFSDMNRIVGGYVVRTDIEDHFGHTIVGVTDEEVGWVDTVTSLRRDGRSTSHDWGEYDTGMWPGSCHFCVSYSPSVAGLPAYEKHVSRWSHDDVIPAVIGIYMPFYNAISCTIKIFWVLHVHGFWSKHHGSTGDWRTQVWNEANSEEFGTISKNVIIENTTCQSQRADWYYYKYPQVSDQWVESAIDGCGGVIYNETSSDKCFGCSYFIDILECVPVCVFGNRTHY